MRQKTTTYGCKITIKRYKRTTECDWKQLEGHTKWPQRDGEQPQKRKMMTNNAYCFPSVWGDILQCTVKRGGGVVYMSVPSSPLCHNPWLQQRQRGNQRWRCRNTYRRNSLKKARWILYVSWLTYKQTGWNSFKTCLPRGRTSSSYPVTPPFFLGVLVGVSYVAHQQELVQGKSSGTARQSWLAPGTDV